MADIFSAAYRQYPPAQEKFGSLAIPEIQDLANEYARAARNYDPHSDFHETSQFVTRLYRLIRVILIVIIVFGLITGASFWVSLSRGVLQTLDSFSQILIATVVSGTGLIALLAGSVLLYAELLSFNSFIIKTLNQQLAIGAGDIATRDEEKLVGYALWNSSLNGGTAIKLLAIFSVLWILSATPWWNPYGYIKRIVEQNIGIFGEADGKIEATKLAFSRIVEQETSESEGVIGTEDTVKE